MKKFTNRLKLFYSLAAMFITFGMYSQTAEEYLSMGNIKGNLENLSGSATGNKNAAMNYPGNPVPEISSPEPTSKFTDYKGAIDFYTKAIDLNPEYEIAYFNKGMTYYNRAVEREAPGDFRKAIDNFSMAIEINPQNARAYGNRGIARGNLRNFGGAISDFNKVIEINPNDAKAYLNRGADRASGYRDYRGAISDYTIAIKLDPGLLLAYYNRGLAYNNIHEYCSAMADFTIAVELNPTDGENYYNRGLAELELGQKENAYADFSKAGELGYILAFDAIRKYCK